MNKTGSNPGSFGVLIRLAQEEIEFAKTDVVFRAEELWKQAYDDLENDATVVAYIVVKNKGTKGNDVEVEYTASLKEVLLNPKRGQPETERLLKLASFEVPEGELVDKNGKPVLTLYHLTDCKNIPPFSMKKLEKRVGKSTVSPGFKSSYALVKLYSEDTPG